MANGACPESFIAFAERLADTARGIVRGHFRSGLEAESKADLSPVTIADREVEAALRAVIEREYPDHGILGEEYGKVRVDAEHVWVIDPIDGTKSFMSGVPLFGTLIALCRRGSPFLGVIEHPALSERWVGAYGRGTRFNGRPAKTRACADLGQALLYTTTPEMYEGDAGPRFERLRASVRYARYGADCYAFGLVASGHIDIVTEAKLSPYDFCALAPVVENAGGKMTDWDGKPLTIHSGDRVLAAGDARAHALALQKLKG